MKIMQVCPEGQVKQEVMDFCQLEGGHVKINALIENGTAWLTIYQLCQLFGETELMIGGYLTSIYAEGELREADSKRRIEDGNQTNYYNLDVVLSLGFRVRSKKGLMFRMWAIKELGEKMLKGLNE